MKHDEDPTEYTGPYYMISFYCIMLLFNIVIATVTWFCFNLIGVISFTDAIVFVVIFRIIEWAKQTILEMCFD